MGRRWLLTARPAGKKRQHNNNAQMIRMRSSVSQTASGAEVIGVDWGG